jgi:hypothetical protein
MCLSHPQKYAVADRMVSAPVTQMHTVTNGSSLRPRPSSAKTRLASRVWLKPPAHEPSTTGYATSDPCLCASLAVTGEVTGNCSTVAC